MKMRMVAVLGAFSLFLGGCFVSEYNLFDQTKGEAMSLANKDMQCLSAFPKEEKKPFGSEARIRSVKGSPNLYDVTSVFPVAVTGGKGGKEEIVVAFFKMTDAIHLGVSQSDDTKEGQAFFYFRIEGNRFDVLIPDFEDKGYQRIVSRNKVTISTERGGGPEMQAMKGAADDQRAFLKELATKDVFDAVVMCRVRD